MKNLLPLFLVFFTLSACNKTSGPAGVAPSPSTEAELSTANAKIAKVNSELLSELMRVVILDSSPEKSMFGSFLENLNQGASLEGIYNGVTRSDFYRKLEISNAGSQSITLRVFGEELFRLEEALPVPTQFEPSSTQPLPLPQHPGSNNGVAPPPETIVFGGAEGAEPGAAAKVWSAQDYSKYFVGTSFFTLKRVLGDEALKVVRSKSFDKKVLAEWYGQWVAKAMVHGVDFGMDLRNKPEAKYHTDWALSADGEALKWEVLNRVHRILNYFEKK